jgi:hypothetical protein
MLLLIKEVSVAGAALSWIVCGCLGAYFRSMLFAPCFILTKSKAKMLNEIHSDTVKNKIRLKQVSADFFCILFSKKIIFLKTLKHLRVG